MPRRGYPVPALAVAAALLLLATVPRSVATAQKEFTAAEKAKLASGGLVVRPEARRRGSHTLIGGLAWQVIDLPVDAVWRAVTDYGNYHRFVPEADQSRVLSRSKADAVVWIRHHRGPVTIAYTMKMHVDPGRRTAEFRVDKTRPHDIEEGWGFFALSPQGANRTLVSFGIFSDVGEGFIAGFVRPTVQEWMLRVPSEFRKFLHGSGRAMYAKRAP